MLFFFLLTAILFGSLQKYEDALLSQRCILQVQLVDTHSHPPTLTRSPDPLHEGNYPGWCQLVSVISNYRLADVIAHVNGIDVKNVPIVARKKPTKRRKDLEVRTFCSWGGHC